MSFKNSKLGTVALWFIAISLIGDPSFVLAVDEKTVQTTKEVTVQAVKPEETVVFLPDGPFSLADSDNQQRCRARYPLFLIFNSRDPGSIFFI